MKVRLLGGVLMMILMGCQFVQLSYGQSKISNRGVVVPVSGNTWQKPTETSLLTKERGVKAAASTEAFHTYVRFGQVGTVSLSLMLGKVNDKTNIIVTAQGQKFMVSVAPANSHKSIELGQLTLRDTGYVKLVLQAAKNKSLPEVKSYRINAAENVLAKVNYVVNNDGNYFYWGRRGPSVHLGYEIPTDEEIEYYYNEITVPVGQDVIGSYYMANGFAEGYFGIQVNSAKERRVLFSVWSPFQTDNPNEIPDAEKIILKRKGADVNTGEFGNEGSGGQSFLRYNWKAGQTYKFLLKGKPSDRGYTEYTAWFYAEEEGKWRLIAQFLRPKTQTYLKRFHSFLENFIPTQGDLERKVLFSNQWVRDVNGKWHECVQARFTADATASIGYRLDYKGGVMNNDFYLQNCGFFADYTPIGKIFKRPKKNKAPQINVTKLPLQ